MAFPSVFPTSADSYTAKTDLVDNVMAVDVNELQSAIVAIETLLGTGGHVTIAANKFFRSATNGATGGFAAGSGFDIIWYRDTGPLWHSNVGAKFDGIVSSLVDSTTGGFKAGASSDVQLYRGAADYWRTPDGLLVDGYLGAGTPTPLAQFVVSNAGAEGFEIDPAGLDQNIYFTAFDRVGSVYVKTTFRASEYSFCISTANKMALAAAGLAIVNGLGCNGTAAQSAYASGGALAAYGAGANGLDSGANMSALHALVVKIRAALVANGIMS